MSTLVSVIIPTHAPNPIRLEKTLHGLREQSLALNRWELLVIDNATPDPQHVCSFDFSWHPSARIIREERLGLTWARIAGIQASQGEYLVFVDDDNVLHPNYLENVLEIFEQNPQLGAIGGKSLPEFEVEPEHWVTQFYKCLALRDLGEEVLISSHAGASQSPKQYPEFAPIGAGMALRRQAVELYVNRILGDSSPVVLDRTGKSLSSGGDNDIVLTILNAGWEVGYFPQLQLSHLMPASRLTKGYIARVIRASSRSWIQVLDLHGIRVRQKIPRWTVLPRKIKAFFVFQPWKDAPSYIRWQRACGAFEGLGTLSKLRPEGFNNE
jgi:glycosyltransferase involved in cell wall biosynthesis